MHIYTWKIQSRYQSDPANPWKTFHDSNKFYDIHGNALRAAINYLNSDDTVCDSYPFYIAVAKLKVGAKGYEEKKTTRYIYDRELKRAKHSEGCFRGFLAFLSPKCVPIKCTYKPESSSSSSQS